MPDFKIVQSDAELEVSFAPRLWSLVHEVPKLYEALLSNLASCQLAPTDLRTEATGTVGGTSLGFWLFGFSLNVNIRLDGFSVRCAQLGKVTREQLVQAIDGIAMALRQAIGESFAILGSTVAYSCHGEVAGAGSVEVISRFTQAAPEVKEFGASNGAGVAFYYADAAPLLSSALTMDVSRAVSGGLFLRVVLGIAPTASSAAVIDLSLDRVRAVFAALDLQEAS